MRLADVVHVSEGDIVAADVVAEDVLTASASVFLSRTTNVPRYFTFCVMSGISDGVVLVR